MKRSFTLFLFVSLVFSATTHAQCTKGYRSVDVDSIFSCWQNRIKAMQVSDSAARDIVAFDTLIQFGDSTGGFGQFRIRMGDGLGGMDFSLKGDDFFNFGDDFFPGLFEGSNPFNIHFGFDNMFRQLEEMFRDFRGIDVIPQPREEPKDKRPTYRI